MKAWNRVAIIGTIVGFTLALSAATAVAYDEEASDGTSGTHLAPLQGNSMGFVGGILFSDFFDDPFMAGVDARFTFDVDTHFALSVNPALTYLFISSPDNISLHTVQLDLNMLGKINVDAPVTPYAGIGVPIMYFRASSSGGSDSDTEVYFNVFIGGASYEFNESISGFTQLRMTRFSEGGFSTTEPALMTGINFNVGGGSSGGIGGGGR